MTVSRVVRVARLPIFMIAALPLFGCNNKPDVIGHWVYTQRDTNGGMVLAIDIHPDGTFFATTDISYTSGDKNYHDEAVGRWASDGRILRTQADNSQYVGILELDKSGVILKSKNSGAELEYVKSVN